MTIYLQGAARKNSELPVTDAEWQARVQLAACYRIFDHLGWTEMIFNHITLRVPGGGREQVWQQVDSGSQSVWPTVTGPIFESGFSDTILQMWAVFLAERHGSLGDRFGAARPEEAALTHAIYHAAILSHREQRAVEL